MTKGKVGVNAPAAVAAASKLLTPVKSLKKPEGYPHKFYAVVSPSGKQWKAGLFGWNHELTWAGERKKNKVDVVSLLNDWFPGIIIKYKKPAVK